MCVHLPVGPSTTLCSSVLLASTHCSGILTHPSESSQNSGDGTAAGGAARGGDKSPPDEWLQGVQLFCISAEEFLPVQESVFQSGVYLFVYVLINLCASALILKACRAPYPGVRSLVLFKCDDVSLCFQRDPDRQ